MISQSTLEAELVALDTDGHEIKWLKTLLSKILIVKMSMPATFVLCHHQAIIMNKSL